MQQMTDAGKMAQEMCVNDLEQPAFDRSARKSGGVHALLRCRKAWLRTLYLACKVESTQLSESGFRLPVVIFNYTIV